MSLQFEQNFNGYPSNTKRLASKVSSQVFSVLPQIDNLAPQYSKLHAGTLSINNTISPTNQIYGSQNNGNVIYYTQTQTGNLPFYGYPTQGTNNVLMPIQNLQGSRESAGYIQQTIPNIQYVQNQQYIQPQAQKVVYYEPQTNYRLVQSDVKPETMNYQVVYSQPPPVKEVNIGYQNIQVDSKYNSLLAQYRELEQRIAIIHNEKERLKTLLQERNSEIEKLKYESANISISLNEMRIYQSKIIELEAKLAKNITELETWQMKFYDLQKEFAYLESSKANESVDRSYYESEITRLRQLFEQKSLEIEDWKYRANKPREPNPIDNQLRFENERLHTELLTLKSSVRRIEDLEYENSRFKTQIEEYRLKITSLESQIFEFRSMKSGNYDLEAKIALLTQEIERLNNLNQRKVAEIESLKIQGGSSMDLTNMRQLLDAKNIEIEDLRAKMANYEMKIALLTQEIERLNLKTGVKSEVLKESIRRTSGLGLDQKVITSYYNSGSDNFVNSKSTFNIETVPKYNNFDERIGSVEASHRYGNIIVETKKESKYF